MNYLQEAFKKFEVLNEEELTLDDAGVDELETILSDNKDEIDFVDVIDPEAETEEDLEDSYIGKVILDCNVCHSKIYKDASEVNLNEEDGVADEGEECPFCYSMDGFTIVGQVAPYKEEEVKVEVEPKEDEEEDSEEAEVDDNEKNESLKSRRNRKNLYESIRNKRKANKSLKESRLNELLSDSDFQEPIRVMVKLNSDQLDRATDFFTKNISSWKLSPEILVDNSDGTYQLCFPGKEDWMNKINGHCKESTLNFTVSDSQNESLKESLKQDKGSVFDVVNKIERLASKIESIKDRAYTLLNNYNTKDSKIDDDVKLTAEEKINKQTALEDEYKSRLEELLKGITSGMASLKEDLDFDTYTDFNHDIYEAVSDVMFNYRDKDVSEKDVDYAFEWFMTHFFDDWDGVDESLKEGLENLDIETEHDKIHVSAEEKKDSDAEMIAPLEPEVEAEIKADSEDEEPEEDEVEIDDFEEDSFNEIGESYLKKVYENVDSFKTSKVRKNDNSLVVEGVIKFKSGNEKSTSFKFEAKEKKNNKLRLVGENLQITKGRKSFTLKGILENKKFISESLNYNYKVNGNRVYGTILKEAELSKEEGTVSNALSKVMDKLNDCKSPQDVYNLVVGVIPEKRKNEKKVKTLLNNIKLSRSLPKAMSTVTNFILKGDGQGSLDAEISGKKYYN